MTCTTCVRGLDRWVAIAAVTCAAVSLASVPSRNQSDSSPGKQPAVQSAAQSTAQPAAQPSGPSESDIKSFDGIKSVTRPSRDAIMGFSASSRVMELLVAGGQSVTKGQLLIRGDDAEDAIVVKLQELRSDTDLPVQKAKKAAELAKLEYERYKEAQAKGSASPTEVDRARVSYEAAVIDVGQAEVTQQQEVVQVDRLKARVDKLRIVAPFDGVVDQISVDVGQTVSESDKIIRVVNVNPLWIDVPVPTGRTLDLQPDSKCWVLMDLPGQSSVRLGKVIEVSAVADAASGTRRVRIALPNPSKTVAGVTAYVRFTEPTEAWSKKIAEVGASK